MKTIKTVKAMQETAEAEKRMGRRIGLVTTMGALHEGHLSLVRKARKLSDIVVVSIFVNPTQFGPSEDLANYPRPLNADRRVLRDLDVEYLFMPSGDEMYPSGYMTWVETEEITRKLEGRFRPTHFRGVTTIVAKLLNAVRPDVAVFGQKDAQQAVVIKQMARDLNVPVKIAVAPTVREKSGLAMSSRNRYFNEEQLDRASCIYRGLRSGRKLIQSGELDAKKVIAAVKEPIRRTKSVKIEYISINDAATLDDLDKIVGKVLISLAVRLDGVRLIDNIVVAARRSRG
jgi:pantoate--beta-alanine ligase